MHQFPNHYVRYRCSCEWSDNWTAICDDDCPSAERYMCRPMTARNRGSTSMNNVQQFLKPFAEFRMQR